MYNPGTLTLLPFWIFLDWEVRAPGAMKDLLLSPALKPILAVPHSMSPYTKNAKESCPSVANTTWNVFSYREINEVHITCTLHQSFGLNTIITLLFRNVGKSLPCKIIFVMTTV